VASYLDHGRRGILVAPHDPAALATALEHVLRSDAERTRLLDAMREAPTVGLQATIRQYEDLLIDAASA
jgi:hypothetical protein